MTLMVLFRCEIAEINTSGLKALLDSGAKVYVLDARTGTYDDGRGIPGAKALAANALEKSVLQSFKTVFFLYVSFSPTDDESLRLCARISLSPSLYPCFPCLP